MREVEFARFTGDAPAVAKFRQQAIVDLDPACLPRHERTIVARGYLDD